jgi:exopolysaccharide biosynthesis polyprenyl glycosylphosphotransferase
MLVFGGRLLAWWILTHAALARRLLIVGESEAIDTTVALCTDPHFIDIQIVGVAGRLPEPSVSGVPVVGTLDAIFETALAAGATGIVVATREVTDDLARQLLRCQEAGIQITSLAVLYEQALHRVPVRHLGPTWIVTNVLSMPGRDGSPLAKRLMDIAVALLLAILGIVLAPVLALAVLLESGRPVLYRQVRLGRGGRPFVLTKFRTMYQDAERNGAQWSTVSDPRLTMVGRVLRRSRLDELPNLFAVLRGDLSMVGPRPERPEFVALLEDQVPFYRARLAATPGLTGWAQINHEYGDSIEDAASKLEYDLYYIKHQSLRFDITILARTVWTMLRFRGR